MRVIRIHLISQLFATLVLLLLTAVHQQVFSQKIYANFSSGEQLVVIEDAEGDIEKVLRSDGKSPFSEWLVGESLTGDDLSYRDGLWTYVFASFPKSIQKQHTALQHQSETFVYLTMDDNPPTEPLDLLRLFSGEMSGSYGSIDGQQVMSVAGSREKGFMFQIKGAEDDEFSPLRPLTFSPEKLEWVVRKPDSPAAFYTLSYIMTTDDTRYFLMSPPEGEPVQFVLQ